MLSCLVPCSGTPLSTSLCQPKLLFQTFREEAFLQSLGNAGSLGFQERLTRVVSAHSVRYLETFE